jgi:hypothetical protein
MALSADGLYPVRAKVFEQFLWKKLSTGQTKFSCMSTTSEDIARVQKKEDERKAKANKAKGQPAQADANEDDTPNVPRVKADDLELPKLEQVSVPKFKGLTNLTESKLYVSKDTNEASLEAFTIVKGNLYMFQLTTQALKSNKKVGVEAVQAIIALAKKDFKNIQPHFCLVVPEDIFSTLLTKGNVLEPASVTSLLAIDGLKLYTLSPC